MISFKRLFFPKEEKIIKYLFFEMSSRLCICLSYLWGKHTVISITYRKSQCFKKHTKKQMQITSNCKEWDFKTKHFSCPRQSLPSKRMIPFKGLSSERGKLSIISFFEMSSLRNSYHHQHHIIS